MRESSLFLYLVGAVGLLLATPLPAAAVPTCPVNAVCIDESVEGAAPTVMSTSSLFQSSGVAPISTGEAWIIDLTMQGSFSSLQLGAGVRLTEPGTTNLSDELILDSATEGPPFTSFTFAFILTSDDENGNLPPVVSLGCVFCSVAVEDGTFQLAISGLSTTAGSFDVYLKSDLDPMSVPEPASLVLFGSALFAFGLMRVSSTGCRTIKKRPRRSRPCRGL